MAKRKAAVSWSGGKDSYLALHGATDFFDVQALLTMFTEVLGHRSESTAASHAIGVNNSEMN